MAEVLEKTYIESLQERGAIGGERLLAVVASHEALREQRDKLRTYLADSEHRNRLLQKNLEDLRDELIQVLGED